MTERTRRFERVDDAMAEVLRQKTDEERLAIGFRMWVDARERILANVRDEHPEWSDLEISREAARRLSPGLV